MIFSRPGEKSSIKIRYYLAIKLATQPSKIVVLFSVHATQHTVLHFFALLFFAPLWFNISFHENQYYYIGDSEFLYQYVILKLALYFI